MKESIYSALTQGTLMLGGIAVFKLLTTFLPTEIFGLYTYLLSFSAIILSFPFTAIQQGVVRYVSVADEHKIRINIYQVVFLLNLLVIFVYFFSYFIYDTIFGLDFGFYFLLFVVSEVFKGLHYTFNNSARCRSRFFFGVFSEFTIKVVLILLYEPSNIIVVFYILVISNVLGVVITVPKGIWVYKLDKVQFSCTTKRIILFSYPLVIWAVFGWMRDMSNRLVINYYLELSDVALFSAVNSIAVILPGAMQAFFGVYFMPILYQRERSDSGYIRRFIIKVLFFGMAILPVLTALVYTFSENIILAISSEKYLSGAYMLAPMFFSFSLFSLAMSMTAEIFSKEKTKLLITPNIISGVVSVLSYIALVYFFGLQGAIVAFFLSYISYAVSTIYIVLRFKG